MNKFKGIVAGLAAAVAIGTAVPGTANADANSYLAYIQDHHIGVGLDARPGCRHVRRDHRRRPGRS